VSPEASAGLATIFVLGLASMMSPGIFVMTSAVLLDRKDPLGRALTFAAAELVVLIPMGLFAGGAAQFISTLGADLSRLFSGWFDIVGGVLLLIAAVGVWLARARVEQLIEHPPVRSKPGRTHDYGMAAVFGIGIYTMMTNVTSLLPFILAAKDIGRLGYPVPVELLLFAVLLVFPMVPTIVPIVLFVAMGPARSRNVTDAVTAALKRYAIPVGVAVALAVAVWMLARGAITLGWIPPLKL
jgi:hypothetical protein